MDAPRASRTMVLLGCMLLLLQLPLALWAFDGAMDRAADELIAAAGNHRLIVIGETHGTRETPAFVGAVARSYADRGPLLLALEVDQDEHAILKRYMSGPGDRLRHEMRQREAWNVPSERNDGRRSEDMLDLIEAMRALRATGHDVAIFPFDTGRWTRGSESRDAAMAMNLRNAYRALPETGRLLVLTGNVHAMAFKPVYCPQCQTPMTSYLSDLAPFTVRIDALEGQYWACRGGHCGPSEVRTGNASIGRNEVTSDTPYHYWLVLPRFSPARLIDPSG